MKVFEITLPLYGIGDLSEDRIKKHILFIFASAKSVYNVHSLTVKSIKIEDGFLPTTKITIKCIYEKANGYKINKQAEKIEKSGLDVYVRIMFEKEFTSR